MIQFDLCTGAMCGSYAFAQALRDHTLNIHLLEMSSGTPFGVASLGENFGFARILTVYKDFSEGICNAAPYFGISVDRMNFDSPEDTANEIFTLREHETIVCGPVNMSCLAYLPLSLQYRAADHFVTFFRNSKVFVSDSEGMPAMVIHSADELARMLSVNEVPEAKSIFSLWRLSRTICASADIHTFILETAAENICEAERHGQGSKAFVNVANLTKVIHPVKWSVPLCVNLGHYIFRKILADTLFRRLTLSEKLNSLNSEAINTAGILRLYIRRKEYGKIDSMLMKLADIEKNTAHYISRR